MPRALLLCEYPALNGGERSLLAVLPTLQQAGWEFDALAPANGALADALAGCGIENIATSQWLSPSVIRHDDRYRQIGEVLTARRYDLVHANSLSTSVLSGTVSHDFHVPTIGHLRDIVGLSRAKVALLNLHSRLLAVSEAVRLFHHSQGLDAAKIEVLYNGIDLDAYRPTSHSGALHRELGIAPWARLIGIVGQLIVRKGQVVALGAAMASMQMRSDVHVVVIGTRHSTKHETVEYERNLHSIVAACGLADRIHFLGTRLDMPRLYPALSLLLHTARQEPLGRVLLEAAACGVPVVATDIGGTREIFPREELDGALLVPVDDVAATEAAVARILDNESKSAAMSIAGRNRIACAFSVEQSAAGLLRHYAEVSGR